MKILLATLLLASAPLLGLADDSSTDARDDAIETNSDNAVQRSKREASDIISPREESRTIREKRQRPYDEHVLNRRGKGGRNPSPDD